MATNDPNKPDSVTYIDPGNKTPKAGGEATAPEMTAEEAAVLAGEGEKALRDIGEEQLEPPAPFDFSGEHVPDNIGEAEKTAGPDKEPAPPEVPATEEQTPTKKGRGGRPPKADRANKTPDTDKPEKPKKSDRALRPPKAPKEEKATPAKEETPPAPAEPEQPPNPAA